MFWRASLLHTVSRKEELGIKPSTQPGESCRFMRFAFTGSNMSVRYILIDKKLAGGISCEAVQNEGTIHIWGQGSDQKPP